VIWQNGNIHERLTSGFDSRGLAFNDPDGFVYGINDKGQVVGASGVCSPVITNNATYLQALHALLWEKDGTVHDLGNLGGTGHGNGTWAITINSQGQVVGASDVEGDQNGHAFLWTRETGIRDLGALPGDDNSGGIWINDGGDVVGVSISLIEGFHPRAFLLPKGATEMINLNDRIPDGSPFHLLFGVGIDDRGEIIALAFDVDDSQVHGVLLTPIQGASEDDKPATQGVSRAILLPENVAKMLQQRLPIGRFGARLMSPR
jgi:probable HAF family extracellular repeat protein